MAAAEGIIAARDLGKLREHGGHIHIMKAWAKSLLVRMGYVKRKCSNAGKTYYTSKSSKMHFSLTSRLKW